MLDFELERVADAGTSSFSADSGSASPTNTTDSVVHTAASMELIDLGVSPSTPLPSALVNESSPIALLPAVVTPMEPIYVFDEKQDYAKPVHFYATPKAVTDASEFALTSAAIPDLLTDSVIHITTNLDQEDASVDLIDLNDPPPPPILSAVVSPVKIGHIYAEKRQYEIRVHFYAVPETEKLEMATRIFLAGDYAEQDCDNNNTRSTKVTLVARSSTELLAAMLRIDEAGMDCFSCDGHSIRDGHSSRPSERISVNVTKAPVGSKIKHSQHVVFLSPTDDPEDVRAAVEVVTRQSTDVNLVSVLFDKSDVDQRLQVSHMLNILALANRLSS